MAEILVLGGMHGNEPLGPALVRSLEQSPITGVDAAIANERAVSRGVRFIDKELSVHARPGGNKYEDRRFGELTKIARGHQLVLDFHNAVAPDTHEAWMFPPPPSIKKAVRWLLHRADIRYVIGFPQEAELYKKLPPTVAVEIGMPSSGYASWERSQVSRWRGILQEMASTGLGNLRPQSGSKIICFEALQAVMRDEAKQKKLETLAGLRRYAKLPSKAVTALGLAPDTYRVLSWGYRNMSKPVPGTDGERECWGQLVRDVQSFV